MKEPEAVIEVEAEVVEENPAEGLTPEELESAKKYGLIESEESEEESDKPEEESEEKSEEESEEKKELSEEEKTKKIEETLTIKDPQKEHEALKEFSANEKALYFKHKKEKHQRQQLQREADDLRARDAARDKHIAELQAKVDALSNKPDDDDFLEDKGLTKKDLEEALAQREKQKNESSEKELKEAEALNERLRVQQADGIAEFGQEKFTKIMTMANEVMKSDESGAYAFKLSSIAASPDGDVIGYGHTLAKLHPDYNKLSAESEDPAAAGKSEETSESKENVKRIVNNANKKKSSAQVGGGSGGKRIISVEDITASDLNNMSQAAFESFRKKHPEKLRELLRTA